MRKWHSDRSEPGPFGSDQGITLVEVLVGLAISSMVGVVVSSLVLFTSSGARSLYRATDYYDSVRLAATLIVQDARVAIMVSCPNIKQLQLTLQKNDIPYEVDYQLKPQTGLASGLQKLVRITTDGGTSVEETIATDLAPPALSSGSRFGCLDGIWTPEVRVDYRLVKPPLPRQSQGIEEKGTVYPR